MNLDHINIKAPADRLGQVRDFYVRVLGLEEGARPSFSSPGHWLYSGDRPLVHLSQGGDGTAGAGPGHLDHVAFRAAGLPEFVARLEAVGVPFRRSFVAELEMTQLFFTDPVGNGLEINFVGEGRS